MDFNFDTGTINGGLATLDVSTLPPLGSGPANILTIIGNGALTLPQGTAAERPAAAGGTDVAGMFRYNTTGNVLEYYNGATWSSLSVGGGTVTSVAIAGSTGLTPSGSPITSSGTITLTLDTGLQNLASFASTGIVVATGTDTWGSATITGTAGNVGVANGDGIAGNPTIDLVTVSQAASGSFVKVTLDSYGRVTGNTPVVTSDITTLVDATYVNISGDTMTSGANLTFVGGGEILGLPAIPTGDTAATSKLYVDTVAAGLSWKQAVAVATTDSDNINIATGGLLTINGYTLASGERVLVKDQVAGAILAFSTLVGGTLYTNGIYNGVNLTGGTGLGATANITIVGGTVTSVVLVDAGTGYTDTDVLSASAANIGGTGSGFSITVNGITTVAENGIYVAQVGTWARASDMDTVTPINEVNGAAVFVESGTTQADTAWIQINNVTTIGVDPVVFTQFAGMGSYQAGTGLTLSGNIFSITAPVSTSLGGTGLSTTASNGQLLIGNGTGYTLASLTAGTAIGITPGAGSITIDNNGVVSLAGTANEIEVSAATGAVTIGLPNDVTVSNSLTVSTLTPNSALYAGTAGVLSSTAALTNGQILVGSTGSAPVATTITEGTGITVANTAGTITISAVNNGTVTSVSGSGGTTGLTLNGGPITTSGTLTLGGTLAVANGGTGTTALGAANTVLGVNAAGTAAEYKTITAGTGMSVVPTAGVITLNNTGVTSVAFSDLSTTPIFTVSGSPVTTTGTLSVTLQSQTANTVFAAPSGSAGQPSFRALTLTDLGTALQLYKETASTPTTPVASGANAVAIGSGSTATAVGSFAEGAGTDARIFGQKAYANGAFATAGDAQHGVYVLRNLTTDATTTELFLDGVAGTQRIVMPDNSVFTFDIIVAARRTDAVGGAAGYRFVGVASKDATSGSITFIGTPSKTVIGETNTPWDASLAVDTTNGSFKVSAIGQAGKTIRWVATVQTTEVTN